jgi:hypothetical protein
MFHTKVKEEHVWNLGRKVTLPREKLEYTESHEELSSWEFRIAEETCTSSGYLQ